ncbi:MAG: DUF2059 domain-containing protein [Chthoniobacteraceae bacterium]|jgi:hypothetical protein
MSAITIPKSARFLLLLPLLPTLHPRPARADDETRTILAEEVLDQIYTPESLRDSFAGFLEPALDAMKRDGMPDAARAEVKKAFTDWFDQEVKWAEVKPKLVQVYTHDFTEEELYALRDFLDKPMGQKVMAKLPLVMQDGALAGQQYFLTKQDSLNARLQPIYEKYKMKPGN